RVTVVSSQVHHCSGPGHPLPNRPLSAAHHTSSGTTLPCAGVVMHPRSPAVIASRICGVDGVARYNMGHLMFREGPARHFEAAPAAAAVCSGACPVVFDRPRHSPAPAVVIPAANSTTQPTWNITGFPFGV